MPGAPATPSTIRGSPLSFHFRGSMQPSSRRYSASSPPPSLPSLSGPLPLPLSLNLLQLLDAGIECHRLLFLCRPSCPLSSPTAPPQWPRGSAYTLVQ